MKSYKELKENGKSASASGDPRLQEFEHLITQVNINQNYKRLVAKLEDEDLKVAKSDKPKEDVETDSEDVCTCDKIKVE